jgi:hypothetical protein
MTQTTTTYLWDQYIETTRYTRRPVRLDEVLRLRMNTFIALRARRLAPPKD